MAGWNGGDVEHVGVKGLHPGGHHYPHHLPSRSRRSSFDGTARLSDMESVGGLNRGEVQFVLTGVTSDSVVLCG